MTEIREGLILTLDQVKTGSFTFKGKEIKLEADENNPLVFRGQTELSKEQVDAGNLNTAFVYNAGVATGSITSYQVIPDNDDFKDLNDAEKITKLNSIEYQFGAEPTDDGKQLDHVLQNSVDTTPSQDKQQTLKTKKQETKEQQQQEESKPTQSTTSNKDNVKFGDSIKVNK